MEVEQGITSGDFLFGFFQGTRSALYGNPASRKIKSPTSASQSKSTGKTHSTTTLVHNLPSTALPCRIMPFPRIKRTSLAPRPKAIPPDSPYRPILRRKLVRIILPVGSLLNPQLRLARPRTTHLPSTRVLVVHPLRWMSRCRLRLGGNTVIDMILSLRSGIARRGRGGGRS